MHLLGDSTKLVTSKLNFLQDFDVDMYGNATFENDKGDIAQISFGMDNSYKCDLEIWGSKASLLANRIFTAPTGFSPQMIIKDNNGEKVIQLSSDDTFKKSINYFYNCIYDNKKRKNKYQELLKQAKFIDQMKIKG